MAVILSDRNDFILMIAEKYQKSVLALVGQKS